MLHPGKMAIPYAYDNFDWPHCEVRNTVGGQPFAFYLVLLDLPILTEEGGMR